MTRLNHVARGALPSPKRYLFYGSEGIGKSTLAISAPDSIVIDLEDGTSELDAARYTFRDEAGGHVPRCYEDVIGALDDLLTAEHSFKTLVIDTVDRLEALLWAFILERDSGKVTALNRGGKTLTSIESYGYGKGYTVALDEWRDLAFRLDLLRSRKGMSIVLVGHSIIRTFKNPGGEDYDRHQLRVHDKAAGFLKEWCDVVGFCTFEEGGGKLDPDQPRAKGWHTGRRLVKLEREAAFDAKTRIPLPSEIQLNAIDPWGPIGAAVHAAANATPIDIANEINSECKRIGDAALTRKVHAALAEAGDDVGVLQRYLNSLRKRPTEEVTQ